jgi:CDP-diacylglycerol--glycerol-3-phosphate 3-phosphatidyltransferase
VAKAYDYLTMLNGLIREPVTRVLTPLARGLLRVGISPGAVTCAGATGAVVASALLIPSGHLFAGCALVGAFALSDLLDGTMARMSGRVSAWGAFLDSNLDRVTDAAIFASIAVYYSTRNHLFLILTLIGLVAGFLVSYARARAESLGFQCTGGLMERAERLIIVLAAIGISGLGVPYIAGIGLWLLAVGSVFTFAQRLRQVNIESRTK